MAKIRKSSYFRTTDNCIFQKSRVVRENAIGRNNNGVSLLSAHMSKGLQFEVVYIIGLSQGTFPDYRAVNAGGKEMEQEKNNMYVAVTRAKRLCYLSYAKYKRMPWGDLKYQQPSQFITSILPKNS